MKTNKIARLLAMVLSFIMIFAMIPPIAATAPETEGNGNVVYASTPKEVTDAINTYIGAAEKFTDVVQKTDLTKMAKALSIAGGLGSLASGSIAILEVTGVIPDPTSEMLSKILDAVKDVQDQLTKIDSKINDIMNEIQAMKVDAAIERRTQNTKWYMHNWNDFRITTVNNVSKHLRTYRINIMEKGKEKWLGQTSHDGVRVLYAHDANGKELVHVYSDDYYDQGIPDKTDEGVVIVKEECIGLPKECMPVTSDLKYSANTWLRLVKERLKEAFIDAANNGKVEWSESKKEAWNNMSDEDKGNMADKYTVELIDSILYTIGCENVKNNDDIATAQDDLTAFCEKIVTPGEGLDAIIQAQYNSYGFEGEAREAIETACDAAIAQTGYYGTAILGIMAQDARITSENLDEVQTVWVKTIQKLSEMKKNAITGHDNYYYGAMKLVDYKFMNAYSMAIAAYRDYKNGDFAKNWVYSDPWELYETNRTKQNRNVVNANIINSTQAGVMFFQYTLQKGKDGGQQDFVSYLNKYGVNYPNNSNGKITTEYKGAQSYSLSQKPSQISRVVIGDHFENNKWYGINNTKWEDKYFVLHDKVVHSCMDIRNGALESNQDLTHRAIYCDSYALWHVDEITVFHNCASFGSKVKKTPYEIEGEIFFEDVEEHFYYNAPVNLLITSNVPKHSVSGPLKTLEDDLKEQTMTTRAVDVPYSKANWSKLDLDNLNLYDGNDSKLPEGSLWLVDTAVAEAKERGLDVSLSNQEKKELADKLRKRIFEMQEELKRNSIVRSLNVLGIDGNDEREQELARRSLQGTYLDSDGSSLIPSENINTMAEYEPYAVIHFEKKKGSIKPVIEAAFIVTPIIVIWDSYLEQFKGTHVSNEVLMEMGLTMDVKLPASFIKKEYVEVIHYDNLDHRKVIEKAEKDVQGSGSNKFVEMSVTSCSPFELREVGRSDEGAATGDNSDMLLAILIMMTSICLALALIARRRMTTKN